MTDYILSFKPAIGDYGDHDPSSALFEDGKLVFAVEEERFTRQKHAKGQFPRNAIEACLEFGEIDLSDLTKIILPYQPELQLNIWQHDLKQQALEPDSTLERVLGLERFIKGVTSRKFIDGYSVGPVEDELRKIGDSVPRIEHKPHHRCHAASAFHPSGFDEAVVVTVDGRGEYDATAVWKGTEDGLERLETFEFPNSLGHFYAVVTEFLGYYSFNGEGKVMGLAPYGEDNTGIRRTLESYMSTGADYDVTDLTGGGIEAGVQKLEDIFDRERRDSPSEFTDWEKDLARVTQELTEEIVCSIVEWHVRQLGISDVCLAGGVTLNCKMNKTVEQLEVVDDLFIQPAAHDAGLALGAGMLESTPSETPPMTNAYWGSEYTGEVEPVLEESKLEYEEVNNATEVAADALADGELVGWYQGRLELGPRALGNRSILADPRTVESRDRVNKYVKHREEWRPFAPSMKEEALNDYLVNATSSPFMIKTYEVREQKRDEIAAALHPGDDTTRPQTVSHEQNPRYYDLLSEFENRTGVPVLLNTSFNDHAEPIVTKPVEAIKDFYGMGLDMLVLEDYVLRK